MTWVYVAVSALAGVLLGWFLGSRRGRADGGMEAELRRQLAEKDIHLQEVRSRENALVAEKSSAIAERDSARAVLVNQQAANDKAIESLRETFTALSADALAKNQTQFLGLAQESFAKIQETAKGDLAQRQEAISGLLKPLEAHLKTYQERLQQTETTQSTAIGEVRKQLETLTQRSESLARETEQFRMVLKSNQARGRWGEETLRRVVEAAGMSAHCDFEEQVVEGDAKPDMIVHLPGDRIIIVDAKVPELDFLNALEAADPVKRAQSLADHARKLKDTIRGLADRDYPSQFPNSLDYVVLFLPAESLFSAALEGDSELIISAAKKKIMLATPASLIGLLRAIHMSWDQFRQTENIRDISEAAQELYKRITVLIGHFDKIRDGLSKANDALNASVGSYERNVRPQGEKLLKLGIAAGGKELPLIEPVVGVMRLPGAGA